MPTRLPRFALLALGASALAVGCRSSDTPTVSTYHHAGEALTATFQNTAASGYTGTVDGFISGWQPGDTDRDVDFTYNTDGTVLTELPVWHWDDGVTHYQIESIIRFDNLSLPAGSTVTSASLTLTFDNWWNGFTMTGYYLKNPWNASQVKWVERDTGLNWAAPGAKGSGTDVYAGTSFSNSTWSANGNEVHTLPLDTTIVQGWIDNPSTNLGVILTNNDVLNASLRVYSSDASESLRPLLTINYTTGCTPTTCAAAGKNCGTISDGCGGNLNCGNCTSPETCGGGGTANVCGGGCTPTTCAAEGKNCGTISDGCGGNLNCGSCTSPETCGGGGTANVCGTCAAETDTAFCTRLGAQCGSLSGTDNCGNPRTVTSCGSCINPGESCGGGGAANTCGSSTCSTVDLGVWSNTSFTDQTGVFTATFDATPSASPIDAVIGLSNTSQTSYSGLAAIVRFNPDGKIDARNDTDYRWDGYPNGGIPYTANTTYHFRLEIDVAAYTYSIYVTPAGGSETPLGTNFLFRDGQHAVGTLNNWAGYVETGSSYTLCNFAISGCTPQTDAAFCTAMGAECGSVSGTDNCGNPRTMTDCGSCTVSGESCGGGGTANVCGSSGGSCSTVDLGVWSNTSFAAQTGTFTATFDATPSAAPIDAVVGLSHGAQTSYGTLAAIVRFNTISPTVWYIDARNGSGYSSLWTDPYTANTTYHFRLEVNVPGHTYSIYVTPDGGAEHPIGVNFNFRNGQYNVGTLDNWAGYVETGSSYTLCNFSTGACTPETDAAFCTAEGANCDPVTGTDNCGAPRTANCGSCSSPESCGGGGTANVCGSCTAETDTQFCNRLGLNCDSVTANDNCNNSRTANCGSCTVSGETCGGGGTANVCGSSGGCTPTTCTAAGKNCGTISDGCGGNLNCGTCSQQGESCGGGGIANVCGQASTGSHPRIWLDAATLTALAAKATDGAAGAAQWATLKNVCNSYNGGTVSAPDGNDYPGLPNIGEGYQGDEYYPPLLNVALCYQIGTAIGESSATINAWSSKVEQILTQMASYTDYARNECFSARFYPTAMAIAYDWVYPALSSSVKSSVITSLNAWNTYIDSSCYINDHPLSNYFAGYYAAKAYTALATEGDNASAPTMWSNWLNVWHLGGIGSLGTHAGVAAYFTSYLDGGGWPESWGYGNLAACNMVEPSLAALTAKNIDLIMNSSPSFHYPLNNAMNMIHFMQPSRDYMDDRDKVLGNGTCPGYARSPMAAITTTAALLTRWNDPEAARYHNWASAVRAQNGPADAWRDFLFWDPNAADQDFTTLQRSYRATNYVSMRSDWSTSGTWGALRATPYLDQKDQAEEWPDAGALVITRGNHPFLVNPQFLDRCYNNTAYDYYDLLENDGIHGAVDLLNTFYNGTAGQSRTTGADDSPPPATGVTRFEDGNGYVYTRAEHLEDMYPAASEVNAWTRNVVYFRPGIFVVYDRTSVANTGGNQHMNWMFAPEPTQVDSTRWNVADPAISGDFKGAISVLLPQSHNFSKVNIFTSNKLYRLEVYPQSPTVNTAWLTVFDAASTSAAVAAGSVISSSSNVQGALLTSSVGNKVALFSSTGGQVSGDVWFTQHAVDTKVVITDLAPGTSYSVTTQLNGSDWKVTVTTGSGYTTTSNGTLYVSISSGGTVTAGN